MRWVASFVIALIVTVLSASGYGAKFMDPDGRGTERFAVVVGVNDPEYSDRQRLKFADDDALAMHQLLTEAGVRSHLLATMDPDTKRLHPAVSAGRAPTFEALLDALKGIEGQIHAAKRRGASTELIFFYSGHGDIHQGEGYVVLPGGRLTRTRLFEEILNPSKADRIHIVIDACKSYFLVFDKGPGGKRTPYPYPFAEDEPSQDTSKVGFVLSASSDRESHEWERYQGGVFSHEVRSAFRGGADADRDGRITYAELGAFLTVANEGIANQRFRPQFLVQPPGKPPGDLAQPILAWPRAETELRADVPNLGHFYVENATGVRVLDVNAVSGQEIRLFLPRQRPLFIRRVHGEVEVEFVLESRSEVAVLSTLRQQPVQVVAKGALNLAFEQLFETPFGPDHVADFEIAYTEGPPPTLVASVETGDKRSRRKVARYAALGTACASATAGLAMTLWAVGRYRTGKEAIDPDIEDINQSIRRLNTTAVVLYSLAGAAAVTYLFLKLGPDRKRSAVTVAPMAAPHRLSLFLTGPLPY